MDPQELRTLIRRARHRQLWNPDPNAKRVSMGRSEIEKMIPHRDPFLFVDEIANVNLDQHCVLGRRHVSKDDPVFRGHFPGQPVYPGVLQLEMIGQAGLCLMHLLHSDEQKTAASTDVRAVKIYEANFLAPIFPGSDLMIFSQAVSWDEYTGICAGQIVCGDVICSCGVLEVYFVGN